jgi:hypothetical protein
MKKLTTKAVLERGKVQDGRLAIGLDLGDRSSFLSIQFLLCAQRLREVVLERQVGTTANALIEAFAGMPRSRIALETRMHSPWVSRLLSRLEHEVIVANPRKVRLIGESRQKDDCLDAHTLARLARIDPLLLEPIQHCGAQA